MNKVIHVANSNTLAFILSQERKHWLLKTDKMKQTQDKTTGDLFEGKVDNRGSEIVVSTEKLPYRTSNLSDIIFRPSTVSKIVSPAYSSLTYSSTMNGLMFARIESMVYPYSVEDQTIYKNYKIEFTNAKEIIVPFGGSTSSSEVYATKWIKTTTKPKLLMMDETGAYSISMNIEVYDDGVTYYYPLDANLQVLKIHRTGVGIYSTDMVNSDAYIGYPLFWFISNKTNIGPTTTIADNYSNAGKQLAFIGNEGNSSRYNANIYFGLAGDMNDTPDDSESVNWILRVYADPLNPFANTSNDFNCKLNISLIELYNPTTDTSHRLNIDDTNIEKITMNRFDGWSYVSAEMYACQMSEFDVNSLSISNNPLISALNIRFKSTIPFYTTETKELGYAGLELTSALNSDQARYPFSMDEFDGIPEWIKENSELGVPQHATLYAIHNTPFYSSSIPDSRQIAALLLDPGIQTTEDSDELIHDERGRVYILSNDPTEYENNATAKHPKPPRTAARICDIPTAVTQFMNVDGLVPVSVVDKNYVRSEAPFRNSDLNRLYNELGSKVVVPTHCDREGVPIYDSEDQNNKYIFNSEELLNKVDLLYPGNNLRILDNLNPLVDPTKIRVARIDDGGTGYAVGNSGIIIIGGCSVDYQVIEVDDTGIVTKVNVVPTDIDIPINLSNFDMTDSHSGLTKSFGSSRSNGVGEGLRISFMIEDYEEIMTKPGKIKDGLIAFVIDRKGMHLYNYTPSEKTTYGENGVWEKYTTISEFEISEADKTKGGASTQDAYLNNMIPSIKPIPVFDEDDNVRKVSTLKTISTSSMINIIDTDNTPIMEFGGEIDNQLNNVDLCSMRGDYLRTGTARYRVESDVIAAIRDAGEGIYDSYLIWRWVNEKDTYDKRFEYGFVTRSFNNWLNTDKVTTIPENELLYNNFVNTNPNTTIVWDVKDVGPMMWMYSPDYKRHERYRIDTVSKELVIEYTNEETDGMMSWEDVNIRPNEESDIMERLVNSYDKTLRFNICSNCIGDNPDFKPTKAVYSQPEYKHIASIGTPVSEVPKPCGNWRLVFPRVNTFSVKVKSTDGSVAEAITKVPGLKLKQLHTIRGDDLPLSRTDRTVTVNDSNGYDVSKNCVFINQEGDKLVMRMANKKNEWEII